MKFSNCDIEIQMGNDVKPKVSIEGDRLHIKPVCKCGNVCSDFSFQTGIDSEILENMAVARRQAEENRQRPILPISTTRSIKSDCFKCGRQIDGTLQFILEKKFLRSFNKAHNQDEKDADYGQILKLHSEVKGGWFNNPRSAKNLITPTCCCGNSLYFPKTTETFERLIQQITDVFEKDTPKPSSTEITEKEETKCERCLKRLSLKTKFTVDFPEKETLSQVIAKYRAWTERR